MTPRPKRPRERAAAVPAPAGATRRQRLRRLLAAGERIEEPRFGLEGDLPGGRPQDGGG